MMSIVTRLRKLKSEGIDKIEMPEAFADDLVAIEVINPVDQNGVLEFNDRIRMHPRG